MFSSGIRTSEAGASAFFAIGRDFSQEGLTVGFREGAGKAVVSSLCLPLPQIAQFGTERPKAPSHHHRGSQWESARSPQTFPESHCLLATKAEVWNFLQDAEQKKKSSVMYVWVCHTFLRVPSQLESFHDYWDLLQLQLAEAEGVMAGGLNWSYPKCLLRNWGQYFHCAVEIFFCLCIFRWVSDFKAFP